MSLTRHRSPTVASRAVLASVIVAAGFSGAAIEDRDEDGPRVLTASNSGEWRGASSCANRGCHGGVAEVGVAGSEFNTWRELDPHARAFLALLEPRSIEIQDKLDPSIEAHENALCLRCHGEPSPGFAGSLDALAGRPTAEVAVAIGPSGVSCEHCHGPSGPWLEPHTRDDWHALSDQEKADTFGMRTLRPAARKAASCNDCHVGDSLDQQVNHDLIAAGHPRLMFEMSLYADLMPRHWSEDESDRAWRRNGLEPDRPANVWAVGQLASLRDAASLLERRAEGAPEQPWPEFSEYSCYACHHDLRDDVLHYSDRGPVPGSWRWNSWMTPGARLVVGARDRVQLDALDRLERRMATPYPMPNEVAADAEALVDELDALLSSLEADPFEAHELRAALVAIASDEEKLKRWTSQWDAMTQLRLAVRALFADRLDAIASGHRDASRGELEEIREAIDALDRLAALLRFPIEHRDSPGIEIEGRGESGGAGAIREQFKAVLGLIRSGDDEGPASVPDAGPGPRS